MVVTRKGTEPRLQGNQFFLERTMWQFIIDLYNDVIEGIEDLSALFDGYIEDDLEN
jgi:hypothetical protein